MHLFPSDARGKEVHRGNIDKVIYKEVFVWRQSMIFGKYSQKCRKK